MYTILFGIGCYIIVLQALIARTEQLIFASRLNKLFVNASFSAQYMFAKWWQDIWYLMKNNFDEKPLPVM